MLKKICDLVEKVCTALGMLAVFLFFICTAWQVGSRILGISAPFTEEVANAAFAWATFMGCAVLLRKNDHFRFTAFSAKLKGKAFLINESIILLILLAFSVLLAVHGVQLTKLFANWRFTSMPSVSKAWGWACVPTCGFASILFCLESIIGFVRDPKTREIHDELEEIEAEVE